MKVVFLDFDGCLNTYPIGKNRFHLDKVPVINFEYLLKRVPELKIVISSAWRIHGLEFCQKALESYGIDPRRVIDITGKEVLGTQSHRGNQIEHWLKKNPEVKKFVILDDSHDMEPYMDRLVRTGPTVGLSEDDVERAMAILKE